MDKQAINKLDLPLAQILKKIPSNSTNKHTKITIKVFSEVTFEPLNKVLSFFLADSALIPSFEISGFDQFKYEISNIKKMKPYKTDFVYVHNSTLNFFIKASGANNVNTNEVFHQLTSDYLKDLVSLINSLDRSVLILNLLELPPYRIRGSHSTRSGIIRTIQSFNTQILSLCNEHKNILIHDANYISANVGLSNWYDFSAWAAFRQPFSSAALKNFGASLSSVIASHCGKSKKVLITDLDNTLWGGIIGEVGVKGIKLGTNSPTGEIFSMLQSYLYDLKSSGIMLAVSSKNEEKNTRTVFDQPSSQLSLEDFSSTKINWSRKSLNIQEILTDLNLGSDSAVFIDDSPAEILEVSGNLPDCSCVSYDFLATEIIKYIDSLGFFETQVISIDDLNRNQSYKENMHRNESIQSFIDFEDYLASLEMKATIFWKSLDNFERLVSLNNKTNQFNTNQVKLSGRELENYLESSSKFVLSVGISDKFGDLGIISVMFGNIENGECTIKNWVLSCRVFNRGIEDIALEALIMKMHELEIKRIRASIKTTEKNMYCRKVYIDFGFANTQSTEITSEYYLDIHKYKSKNGGKNGSSITVTFS